MKDKLAIVLALIVVAIIATIVTHLFGAQPEGFVFWQTFLYFVGLFTIIELVREVIKKVCPPKDK